MSLFDGIFNTKPQQEAAAAQKVGLQQGLTNATTQINTGQANTNTDYSAGLQPFVQNLGVTQAGQGAYADATGANGSSGYDRAVSNFHAGPGYDFALEQGNQNVLRNQSATGQLASGETNLDLQKFGQGLADQRWQQYIAGLQPFVGASTANAGGAAGVNVAKAGTDSGFAGKLADLNWQTSTGMGNADANAALARTNANANIINFGQNAAKSVASFLPFLPA